MASRKNGGVKQALSAPDVGAPAYMGLYTSLMTILLTFFITMLSLSSSQDSGFQAGIGSIRDALGVQGALGMLPFWSYLRSSFFKTYPQVKESETNDKLLGYTRDMVWEQTYADIGFLKTEYINRGVGLRVLSPLRFPAGGAALDREGRQFLDRVGGILYALPDTIVTVSSMCRSDRDDAANQLLATRRAATVLRYLEERSSIPRERLRAVGYAHDFHLGDAVAAGADQVTVLFIHKTRAAGADSAGDAPFEE